MRNIPAHKKIGLFGMIGRISLLVTLKDMGSQKDRVPNMSMAAEIVKSYQLAEPAAYTSRAKPHARGPGCRVKARRGRRSTQKLAEV